MRLRDRDSRRAPGLPDVPRVRLARASGVDSRDSGDRWRPWRPLGCRNSKLLSRRSEVCVSCARAFRRLASFVQISVERPSLANVWVVASATTVRQATPGTHQSPASGERVANLMPCPVPYGLQVTIGVVRAYALRILFGGARVLRGSPLVGRRVRDRRHRHVSSLPVLLPGRVT
jgi:hypothetical protein